MFSLAVFSILAVAMSVAFIAATITMIVALGIAFLTFTSEHTDISWLNVHNVFGWIVVLIFLGIVYWIYGHIRDFIAELIALPFLIKGLNSWPWAIAGGIIGTAICAVIATLGTIYIPAWLTSIGVTGFLTSGSALVTVIWWFFLFGSTMEKEDQH